MTQKRWRRHLSLNPLATRVIDGMRKALLPDPVTVCRGGIDSSAPNRVRRRTREIDGSGSGERGGADARTWPDPNPRPIHEHADDRAAKGVFSERELHATGRPMLSMCGGVATCRNYSPPLSPTSASTSRCGIASSARSLRYSSCDAIALSRIFSTLLHLGAS